MRKLTYYIEPSGNAGDSLSIINANLINLDLALNNIQSILIEANGMNSYFTDLSSKTNAFNSWMSAFSAKQIEFSQIYATVALLSSHWQNITTPHEFTIYYPIDVSVPTNSNLILTGKSVGKGLTVDILENLTTSTVLGLQYLNASYSPNSYADGTKVIVAMPIYNSLAGLDNPTVANIDQIQGFSLNSTTQNPIYYKPGTYLVGIIKEIFQKRSVNNVALWSSLTRQVCAFNL